MTSVAQTVTLFTRASRERCLEALRRVFESRGGRVSADGEVVVGRFGSQMLMHMIGGALMPASRVPVVVRGAVEDAPGARRLSVEVDGDLGFATLIGWEKKVRRRCETVAAELREALASELGDAEPGVAEPFDAVELPIPWKDLQRAFPRDGSLPDVVVADTDVEDWERAYQFVRHLEDAGIATIRAEPDPFPSTAAELLAVSASEHSVILRVSIRGVELNSHFFGDEIEFDVLPSEIVSETEAKVVLGFMRGLADATAKPVHLTPDGVVHERHLLSYFPDTRSWIAVIDPESA